MGYYNLVVTSVTKISIQPLQLNLTGFKKKKKKIVAKDAEGFHLEERTAVDEFLYNVFFKLLG